MKCSACNGPYHPATGHAHSEKTRLCGVCAIHFVRWLKGHLKRRWGKLDFYEHAATSIRAKEKTMDGIKILGIRIHHTKHGPDYIFLKTELPNGCWPYNGTTELKFEVAAGSAEEYVHTNFPGVSTDVITT